MLNFKIRKLQDPYGVRFPKLDCSSLHVTGYSDTGFGNNKGLTSQLGFIVLLKD